MLPNEPATRLLSLLEAVRAGETQAREDLLQYSLDRLRGLARRMFRSRGRLGNYAETDDVLARALVRLYRALQNIQPDSTRAYFGLVAQQLRWVLGDMAREAARLPKLLPAPEGTDSTDAGLEPAAAQEGGPASLLEWAEFHRAVEGLPPEEREVFDLLWYKGLSQEEAADLLQIGVRTLKRRWRVARLFLARELHGTPPPLD